MNTEGVTQVTLPYQMGITVLNSSQPILKWLKSLQEGGSARYGIPPSNWDAWDHC